MLFKECLLCFPSETAFHRSDSCSACFLLAFDNLTSFNSICFSAVTDFTPFFNLNMWFCECLECKNCTRNTKIHRIHNISVTLLVIPKSITQDRESLVLCHYYNGVLVLLCLSATVKRKKPIRKQL
ncbi:hypothetical protein AAHE18_02G055600 [Arachis hypogaea]